MNLQTRLIGLVSAFALVAAAGATTTKISAFVPAGTSGPTDCQGAGDAGSTVNPDVDGTGTLKFNASTNGFTRLHLQISELEPTTVYSVMLEAAQGTRTVLNAFVTNPAGHGVFISDTDFEGDWSADPIVTIFRWDGVIEDFVAVHTGDRDTLDCWHETRAASILR